MRQGIFEIIVEQRYFSGIVNIPSGNIYAWQVGRECRFTVVMCGIYFGFGHTQLLVVAQGHLPARVEGKRLLCPERYGGEQTENTYEDTLFHFFVY